MALTVEGETATQACRRYASRATGPSSSCPARASHQGKCMPN